jgi:cell division protein YceG involved in septum cleavage
VIPLSKLRQEELLAYYFSRSFQLEDMLMKKYELPKKMLKDKILDQMIKDFKKNNREHMKDLSDKMNRLGIQ